MTNFQTRSIRTYSELVSIPDFHKRYDYLKLSGSVGQATFGFDRYLNQEFYRSREWKRVRREVILRDNGCDMGIISWIIVGGIAGWLAGLIVKGSGSGIFLNIVIGIVGAFIGGILMNLIGDVGITGFNIWSLLVALVGAIVLLLVVSLFRRGKK